MPCLASVEKARHILAALVLDVGQYRRAYGIKIPDVMRDVLEVANILAGVEIDGDQ